MTLNYRLIDDPTLKLADRIILSYIYKWNYWNRRRKAEGRPEKPLTVYRFRKLLGWRTETIQKSLIMLETSGYITAQVEVAIRKNDPRYLGFRKLKWDKDLGPRFGVFEGLMKTNKPGREVNATWLTRVLGISRRTAYNWLLIYRNAQETKGR